MDSPDHRSSTGDAGPKAQFAHSEITTASDDLASQGAVILESERDLSAFQLAKRHWRVILTSSFGFTSGLAFGYDVVANGASISMPAFLLYFGDMGATGPYLPSLWTSLWTGMSALFQAAGAIIIGWLADRFGRKWPSCSAAVVTMIGTVLQYVAVSRVVLLWGKMITGLGVGALMATGATYISEIAPPSLRAPLQTGLVIFVLFTQGVALGVVRSFVPDITDSSFRMVFAIQWIVGGISLMAWAVAPESPIWLARKGRMQAAQKSMERIYGKHNDPNERLAYELQTLNHEAAKMGHGSYAACFQGTDLKRTLTSAFLFSTSNIGGGSFLSQNIYFLITAGLEAIHAFDVGVGGFALALVFIIGSGFYLQYISRRNVVLIGLSLNLVFMAIIGALYWASGKGPLWAIAVLMNILISIQSSTLQAAGWPIAAEVPSLRLRAKTLSIGIFAQTFTTWLFNFVTPYMYNVDSGNLGARTGLIYAGTSVVLVVVAWRLVPDVTDMTTEEIDRAYETGVAPSAFQKQKVNSIVQLGCSIRNYNPLQRGIG